MKITVCAKCLEEKCECERYRRLFPEEWRERDRLGYAPDVMINPPLVAMKGRR